MLYWFWNASNQSQAVLKDESSTISEQLVMVISCPKTKLQTINIFDLKIIFWNFHLFAYNFSGFLYKETILTNANKQVSEDMEEKALQPTWKYYFFIYCEHK